MEKKRKCIFLEIFSNLDLFMYVELMDCKIIRIIWRFKIKIKFNVIHETPCQIIIYIIKFLIKFDEGDFWLIYIELTEKRSLEECRRYVWSEISWNLDRVHYSRIKSFDGWVDSLSFTVSLLVYLISFEAYSTITKSRISVE